jgi:type IV pilus assembly protein PilN
LSEPLAEHDRLLRTQDEQRKKASRAASLSEPLAHLGDLLEALSFEPGDGVVLRQLRQREHETQLLATSRDHLASADWLKRLGAVRGVKAAEVSDLHRPATRGGAHAEDAENAPVEFGARLRWDEPAPKAVRTAATTPASAMRAMKAEPSGGEK